MKIINTHSDRNGKIAAVAYTLLCLFFLFALKCESPEEPYANEGVVVNLGYTESGKTDNTPEAVQEEIAEPTPQEESVEEPQATEEVEESITQETEVVDVSATETPTPTTTPTETEEQTTETTENTPTEEVTEPVEESEPEKPQVDESALFPGENNNPNQGTGNENGDQGNPEGSIESNIYGDITGPGLGDSGKGWGLNGRSLGHKPMPVSEKQSYGVVTIKIRVGKNGKVIQAQFSSRGSTTTDKYLIDLSIKEAYKVTFNPDPKAPEVQVGFVSFHYKPN